MSALLHAIGAVVFAVDLVVATVPVTILNAQNNQQASLPRDEASGSSAVVHVMFNPIAPINLYGLFAALFVSAQSIAALIIAILVFTGQATIAGSYNAESYTLNFYVTVGVLATWIILTFTSGVWAACASMLFTTFFVNDVFNQARYVDPQTHVVAWETIKLTSIIVPLLAALILKFTGPVAIVIMNALALVHGATLAIFPKRAVWDDSFTMTKIALIACVLSAAYVYIFFAFIVRALYRRVPRDERKRHPNLMLVAISIWGADIDGAPRNDIHAPGA